MLVQIDCKCQNRYDYAKTYINQLFFYTISVNKNDVFLIPFQSVDNSFSMKRSNEYTHSLCFSRNKEKRKDKNKNTSDLIINLNC